MLVDSDKVFLEVVFLEVVFLEEAFHNWVYLKLVNHIVVLPDGTFPEEANSEEEYLDRTYHRQAYCMQVVEVEFEVVVDKAEAEAEAEAEAPQVT